MKSEFATWLSQVVAETISKGYSSDLFLTLPIYLKLLSLEYVPSKDIRVKAKIHKALLDRVTIHVLGKNQKEQLVERKTLKSKEHGHTRHPHKS
jgi:hypothetical protein